MKYLESKRKKGPTKYFLNYMTEYLRDINNVESITHIAIQNGEDEDTVHEDIQQLKSRNSSIGTIIIYYKALIYSHLFKVKLNRHQYHSMYTLNELTKLNRYNNSFVCHYDKESM